MGLRIAPGYQLYSELMREQAFAERGGKRMRDPKERIPNLIEVSRIRL